jgi:hypothetical protein
VAGPQTPAQRALDRLGWMLAAMGIVGWIVAPRALILWAFLIVFGVATLPQQVANWWKARRGRRSKP